MVLRKKRSSTRSEVTNLRDGRSRSSFPNLNRREGAVSSVISLWAGLPPRAAGGGAEGVGGVGGVGGPGSVRGILGNGPLHWRGCLGLPLAHVAPSNIFS